MNLCVVVMYGGHANLKLEEELMSSFAKTLSGENSHHPAGDILHVPYNEHEFGVLHFNNCESCFISVTVFDWSEGESRFMYPRSYSASFTIVVQLSIHISDRQCKSAHLPQDQVAIIYCAIGSR